MQYSTLLAIITIVYCSVLAAFFGWRVGQAKNGLEVLALIACEITLLAIGVIVLYSMVIT